MPLEDPSAVRTSTGAVVSLSTIMEAMLREAPYPVFVVDRQGRYLYVGEAGARALGLPASEIVGKAAHEFGLAPEVAADLAAQTERVFQTKQPLTGTALIPTIMGLRLFEHRFSPLFDEHGEVTSMLCMARDVTDPSLLEEAERMRDRDIPAARREAENALREQQERYRLIVENAQEGIWLIRPDTTIAYVNPQMARMLGYSVVEMLGRSFFDFVCTAPSFPGYPEEAPNPQQNDRERMEGLTKRFELRCLRKDGSELWTLASVNPMIDEERHLIGTVALFTDLTERKQAEDKPKESEAQLRRQARLLETLLDNIPTGITIADPPDVRIRKVSRYAEQISGIGSAELEEKPQSQVMWNVYHADGVTPATEEELPLTRSTLQGEVVWGEEWVVVHPKTGEKMVLLCNASPVRDDEGNILSGILAWSDITRVKNAQEEIAQLNERLHRAIVEASHRIKNQLQVLNATADMMLMDDPQSVSVEEVRRLRSQIGAIAATHDLLTLKTKSDGTAGRLSLKALLERTLDALQQTTSRHRVRYTLNDVLVPVNMATSLALIVNETVSNAIKHGGGDIEVILEVTEGQGKLEVCDDGSGFPAGFDPHRAASTGIELVMALVRHDLGGSITFENRREGGGRVRVVFPSSSDNNQPKEKL